MQWEVICSRKHWQAPLPDYPKSASALHLHGSDSGACVRTVCTIPRPRAPPHFHL